MTTPDPPLTTAERLEARYGLSAADLSLDEAGYARRVTLWERLAAQQGGAPERQQARVHAAALTATITALLRRADRFRAEGDITTERDMLGRAAVFQGWLKEAAQADPEAPGRRANPAPELGGYGLR